MKETGIVIKIDSLGRVVIPSEIRRVLDIQDRDDLEIYTEGDKILLAKHAPACLFCDSTGDTVKFKGKLICRTCLDELCRRT